ncbi:MAG: hypothetical protein GTN78_26245, partial [Gemmatimonadales bacterium]|nr:hypothetical protein [Gemmatimonadales bacterium]
MLRERMGRVDSVFNFRDGAEEPFRRQFVVVSHLLFAVGLIGLLLAGGQVLYVAVGLAACPVSVWGALA